MNKDYNTTYLSRLFINKKLLQQSSHKVKQCENKNVH